MELLTQEKLRDLFKKLTGSRASTDTVKACVVAGLPYIEIRNRKLFNKETVLIWLKARETQSPFYINTIKYRK